MKISEIMSAPVLSVRLDDALQEVEEIFARERIRHLVVIEDSKLFGVLSENDLLRAISPYVHTHIYTTRDLASLNQRVHQIVRRNPVSLSLQSTVQEAISLFNTLHVSCIPIIDLAEMPVGIITPSNIMGNFYKICAANTSKIRA
ncbi:CBS domain-containing protein [Methylobacter sp. S3L5C]|uniref:CBS domain-containing protein n=1 Tax=Methylobacter sp. S3L5C TaxID=2839024 RepID=UPI001FAE64AF|nr:CBS domain-containing protein [Methylobacter sp. S3L5C]UOA09011.1 CBS domain-containing protein [Methylobacter sp. S3L5C]